jgi:hypothetical protein
MNNTLTHFLNFATKRKEQSAEDAMNPLILVEGKDGPMAIAIAPSLDKKLVHRGLLLSWLGFPCEGLGVVYDAVVKNVTGESPMSEYDIEEGKLHCLIGYHITKKGEVSQMVLPYAVEENQVQWMRDGITFQEDDADRRLKGHIPNMLRKLRKEAPLTKQADYIKELMDDVTQAYQESNDDMSPERVKFHISRAVIAILIENGFKVMDNFSRKHIEWTGAKEKGQALITAMIEEKLINNSHEKQLRDCIDKYMGSPTFKEKFEHFIVMSGYESVHPVSTFSDMMQTLCISPAEPNQTTKLL